MLYLGLVLLTFIMPEIVYRLYLLDFSAALAENQVMIVRSTALPLYSVSYTHLTLPTIYSV